MKVELKESEFFTLFTMFPVFSDLSYNQLTCLDESSFVGLSLLERLNLGDNRVTHIADGVFRFLSNLQTL